MVIRETVDPVSVAVLGAGLQGVCTALELASRGVSVALIDQDHRPFNRASLRNEGKVHLGFVYAKDRSLKTAELMLDGALCFRRLLNGWTEGGFDRVALARPFVYLVANDSSVASGDLAEHYERVQRSYRVRIAADRTLDYLGERPAVLCEPVPASRLRDVTTSERISDAYQTVETSIDLEAAAKLLRSCVINSSRVRFHAGRRVTALHRTSSGFRVEGTRGEFTWSLDCDQVVNALWDGRMRIDADLGLHPGQDWSCRLKYRVLVDLPPQLRGRSSATFVLGPYGDIVVYPDGRGYVSWYPECMRGWSDELEPPASWNDPCRGVVAAAEAAELAARVLQAADPWFPGLAAARPTTVDAGTIFALGNTDITDPTSRLHRRDDIGVVSIDGYHSISTGKLTTAPMFAVHAAAAVTARA